MLPICLLALTWHSLVPFQSHELHVNLVDLVRPALWINLMLNQDLITEQWEHNQDRKRIRYVYGRGFPHDIGLGQRPGWESGSLIAEVKKHICLMSGYWLTAQTCRNTSYIVLEMFLLTLTDVFWHQLTADLCWKIMYSLTKLLLGNFGL